MTGDDFQCHVEVMKGWPTALPIHTDGADLLSGRVDCFLSELYTPCLPSSPNSVLHYRCHAKKLSKRPIPSPHLSLAALLSHA